MLPTLLLTVSGGILAWRVQSQRRQPPFITLLAPLVPARPIPAEPPATLLTDEQNLALSVSLLGMTTVGHFGLPLLRLLSTPGLLYLNFYFIRTAYGEWQTKRQIGIATNDAVLATGLVVTRQLGAGSLFATLFFASRKLQAQAEANLAHYLRPTVCVADKPTTPPSSADQAKDAAKAHHPAWQAWIDRGALPLLTLSVVSTPLLGMKRALAVLLTNFGYDYRITAPLSTLSYLRVANAQGIWLCDPSVLDRLQQVDVLVLAVDWHEPTIATLQVALSVPVVTLPAQSAPAPLIMQLQAEGRTVAYFTNLASAPAAAAADLRISVAAAPEQVLPDTVHVILPGDHPVHLQQLFALTNALAATQQRGFYLAIAPGLLNLGGIYFGQFGVMTALLVDYGGALVGMLNATWPQLPADVQPNASV